MQHVEWKQYSLSRLMLGTVQFGMPYGVANRTGQPTEGDVREIVAAAFDGGVNCFDTAAAYGTSEEVLGRVLSDLRLTDRVVVVTKVRALTPDEASDPRLAARAITDSVETSRQRLGIETLPVVLFHREPDAAQADALRQLRDRGWVRYVGVSCDNVAGPARAFAESGEFDALQIPANVLDRRHSRSGLLETVAARDVALFVRSVYLQGLLVMPEPAIPPHLQEVLPVRRALERLAQEAGMSLAELCLRAMLSLPGVTSLLTGVETVAQVRDNLALFDRGPLAADLLTRISATVPDLPASLLTPWQWPSRLANT